MQDETYAIIDEFSSYVKPVYGVVNHFIQDLTGIRSTNVKTAQSLEAALRKMLTWIGTQEFCFFTWSDSDYNQLSRELLVKGVSSEEFSSLLDPDKWIDYQVIFENRFRFGRQLSLKDALFYMELEPEGKLHDGLADACNTAKIIKLEFGKFRIMSN